MINRATNVLHVIEKTLPTIILQLTTLAQQPLVLNMLAPCLQIILMVTVAVGHAAEHGYSVNMCFYYINKKVIALEVTDHT